MREPGRRGRARRRLSPTVEPEIVPTPTAWTALVGSRSWDSIIDIGSNDGSALRAILPVDEGTVIAFEPHPRRAQLLRAAFQREPVRIEEVAVSDDIGISVLRQDGIGRQWTLEPVSALDDSTTFRVATTSLSQYFADAPHDSVCIRLGTAGHETQVLAGAAELFTRVSTAVVLVDVRHMGDKEIERFASSWHLFAFDPRGPRFVDISASPRLAAPLLRSGWCDPYDLTLVPRGAALPWSTDVEAHR